MRDPGPGAARTRLASDDGKPRAWITYRKKDGTGVHSGTIALNPDYVRVHHEWLWREIELPKDEPQWP